MVEHHLAKVRVASSNLVIRSQDTVEKVFGALWFSTVNAVLNLEFSGPKHGGVAERRGSGLQSRVHGFESRSHLHFTAVNRFQQVFLVLIWAIGAAVARFPDTEEVTGSIPVSPTTLSSFVTKLLFCCPDVLLPGRGPDLMDL